MPLRLPIISKNRKPSASGTRVTCRVGNAEVMAETPAEMLTATVSV
jgi:hypothetical protein